MPTLTKLDISIARESLMSIIGDKELETQPYIMLGGSDRENLAYRVEIDRLVALLLMKKAELVDQAVNHFHEI